MVWYVFVSLSLVFVSNRNCSRLHSTASSYSTDTLQTGRYFDNIGLEGEHSVERVDPIVDFTWGSGHVIPSFRDRGSIEWTGFVDSWRDEDVTFHVTAGTGDYVRLDVDGVVLMDGEVGYANGSVPMKKGVLYDVRLMYAERDASASIKLEWSSESIERSVVPTQHLFYGKKNTFFFSLYSRGMRHTHTHTPR